MFNSSHVIEKARQDAEYLVGIAGRLATPKVPTAANQFMVIDEQLLQDTPVGTVLVAGDPSRLPGMPTKFLHPNLCSALVAQIPNPIHALVIDWDSLSTSAWAGVITDSNRWLVDQLCAVAQAFVKQGRVSYLVNPVADTKAVAKLRKSCSMVFDGAQHVPNPEGAPLSPALRWAMEAVR